MAGVKGNKNGRGAKGRSGRKSAYQEKADAELLWKIFTTPMSKKEALNIIRHGHYTIKDVWVAKLFGGNIRLLEGMVKKLFPEKMEHTGSLTISQVLDALKKK
jgi:hypothetical protein